MGYFWEAHFGVDRREEWSDSFNKPIRGFKRFSTVKEAVEAFVAAGGGASAYRLMKTSSVAGKEREVLRVVEEFEDADGPAPIRHLVKGEGFPNIWCVRLQLAAGRYQLIIPPPGHPLAVEMGCTCPVVDNSHGKGWPFPETGSWVVNFDCPVHKEVRR